MSQCPSAHQLERLLEEQLPDKEQRDCSIHVSACVTCQATLEGLTAQTRTDASVPPWAGGKSSAFTQPDRGAKTAALTPFLARLKEASPQALFAASRAVTSSTAVTWHANMQQESARTTPVVPGYEIVSELGRGGMGVVYKARQTGLNRLVALKVILAGPHARPKDLVRFRQEAEAVASLHHPNIVQIYDIGEANGIPYLVLEYVEEGSLVQRLRGDPQDLKAAVRLIETLARTVHFAHQRGIVHRDLKPANILLQRTDKVTGDSAETTARDAASVAAQASPSLAFSAPLSPKITDFGLAKRLDEEDQGTPSGEIVGTPSYMAPEQAGGKHALLGPATDVYTLGAILYEMFTGRPPFKGPTPLDTVVQVVHEEPVRPSRLRSGLPLDLETICLKCLSKEPSRRYATAEALADDLQRFLKGKPILARPVGLVERAWKWSRRRPLISALVAGMILSVVLGFAGVTWQWQEARLARDIALDEKRDKEIQSQQAETARAIAIDERKKAQVALYFSRIAQSQLQWRVNNVIGARESLTKCVPENPQDDLRHWEWHYLRELFHGDLMTLYHSQTGNGGTAVFHPDGRTIISVLGGHSTDDAVHAGEVRFWDAKTGALLRTLRAPGTAHRLVLRSDGSRLALATMDGSVLVWDTATGNELLRTKADGQMIPSIAFSPDGRLLAWASWDQTVQVLDAETGRISRVLKGHAGPVQSVAFHPDGKKLASGDGEATVKVWDVALGQELLTLRGHKSPVYGVAFSPDGQLLLSGSSNGNLKIWDMQTGRAIQSLTSQSGTVFSNCFSPDGRYLAYCGGDATVRVWDLETGLARVTFRGHTAPVESVQFSPDGQRLVSSSPVEGTVKVWDFTRHPEQATFARVRGRAGEQTRVRDLTSRADTALLSSTGPDIEALAFHADGEHLVSVAVGGELQIWDAASGVLKEQRSLPMCEELITPAALAAFNPTGKRLAGRAREDETLVKIWNVGDGKEEFALPGHTLPVIVLRFSSDGRRLVSCACDINRVERPHEVKIWDALTGNNLATWTGQGLLVSAAFSHDNLLVALGAQNGDILVVDWADSRTTVRLRGHKNHVAALAFANKSRLLASAGVDDRMLKLWDLNGFDPASDPPPRTATITAPPLVCDLAFTPDDRRLAGISRDVVKVWDVSTHHEVLALRGAPQRHWDPAFNPRVAFSPDGKRLAGTNWNESISMWDTSGADDDEGLAKQQLARQRAADARAAFWHLQEAEDCWLHHNFDAARFHLQRLGDSPLPGPLQARINRLAKELQK
jgi:WD40 repeat protein/serine/threonine protein kinase